MKPLKLKAWACVGGDGEVVWDYGKAPASLPRIHRLKPDSWFWSRVERVLVTITAAKRAKRRRK